MNDSTTNLTIEQSGRRLYVAGNSFPIKDQLKSIGCKWDGETKQWWIGTAKRAELEAVINNAGTTQEQAAESVMVTGRATYKGKSYYVVWDGNSRKTGEYCCKLCFRDGSKEFWAKEMDQLKITKRYNKPQSIADLQAYAKDYQQARENGHALPASVLPDDRSGPHVSPVVPRQRLAIYQLAPRRPYPGRFAER